MSATTEIVAELRRALEERDEAIEKLEALREHITGKLTYATEEDPEHPDFDQLDAEDSVDAAAEELRDLRKERDEARADAERYLADLRRCAAAPYEHAKERAEAFRQGAEAMREACARWVDHWVSGHVADKLRDMPIPEEP